MSIRAVERDFAADSGVVHALGPIDLEVRESEFLCIVGPSGCGKSTLLRILAGLLNPTRGRVELVHRDPTRPLTSVVFQDHSVLPWKSVEANVRYGLDLRGDLDRAGRRARARHYVKMLGLEGFESAFPDALSGGMRQRVAIGRAMAVEPEILLMDEPFAALDAQMRTVLQDDLVDLWESDRRTVIFITHSIEEALFLGDRVIVMSNRPGTIRAEIDVPFPRPRRHDLRGSADFAALHEEIWEILRVEVDAYLQRSGPA